jgi:hypothetical protein
MKKFHRKLTVSPKCFDNLPPNGWKPEDPLDLLAGGCDEPRGEGFVNGILVREES